MKTSRVNYWISYSDLMSGLLFMFILLFVVILLQHQSSILIKEEELRTQQEDMKKARLINEELQRKNQEQQKKLIQIQEQVRDILELKKKIIELLVLEFNKKGVEVRIDPFTGAIHLPSKVLFDSNKWDLKEKGKVYLSRVVPIWLDILLFHPLVSQYIAEIIVEGHTDPRSSYLYNLKLSQNRALSVVKFIMSDEFEELEEKNTLRKMLTANGRSFMDLIMREDEPTKADYEKSRRVIFKFRLKSEEQLARIEDAIGQFRNPDN